MINVDLRRFRSRYHQSGSLIAESDLRRGRLGFDLSDRLESQSHAADIAKMSGVVKVFCCLTGSRAATHLLGPEAPGRQRRETVMLQREMRKAGFTADEVDEGLAHLDHKAELLIRPLLPIVRDIADRLSSGTPICQGDIDAIIDAGRQQLCCALTVATAAIGLVYWRAGNRVVSLSIDGVMDPWRGHMTEVLVDRSGDDPLVRRVLDAREDALQFDALRDACLPDIDRLDAVCLGLLRGQETAEALFPPSARIQGQITKLLVPIAEPIRPVLHRRAEQTALIAHIRAIVTERDYGMALPDVSGSLAAAMQLTAVTESHREAQRSFADAQQAAVAFLDTEDRAIDVLAAALARRTTLTEHDIRRVMGS